MQSESQNIEYKESWNDKYLQWICGFANAQGGRIYIGINDEKEIIGVHDSKKLMEDILKSKYLYSPIHYEGMERVEPLEIPEDGLREILYNSVCHKEYMGAPIQMQVYSDHIEIWNEGGLPEGYTAETLMRKHSSRPRNKTIAAVMFRAGFIETWGRGYTKVRESFEKEDYPMPIVTEIDGGVSVWIKRFSLEELVVRNKKSYGEKAPNMGITDMQNVGNNVGNQKNYRKRFSSHVRLCKT